MRETYGLNPTGTAHDCRRIRTTKVLESLQELCDLKAQRTVLWEMIKLAATAPATLDIASLLSAYEDVGGGN